MLVEDALRATTQKHLQERRSGVVAKTFQVSDFDGIEPEVAPPKKSVKDDESGSTSRQRVAIVRTTETKMVDMKKMEYPTENPFGTVDTLEGPVV